MDDPIVDSIEMSDEEFEAVMRRVDEDIEREVGPTTPEDYDAYYRRCVAAGLADVAAGRTLSQEEVERRSLKRQAELIQRIKAGR